MSEQSDTILYICSAYKECPIDDCPHKTYHECNELGMHRFSICYDSKINSSCLKIVDGKIPRSKWKKCSHCGHSEHVVIYETVMLARAGGTP